jgi:hypothetical protein
VVTPDGHEDHHEDSHRREAPVGDEQLHGEGERHKEGHHEQGHMAKWVMATPPVTFSEQVPGDAGGEQVPGGAGHDALSFQ